MIWGERQRDKERHTQRDRERERERERARAHPEFAVEVSEVWVLSSPVARAEERHSLTLEATAQRVLYSEEEGGQEAQHAHDADDNERPQHVVVKHGEVSATNPKANVGRWLSASQRSEALSAAKKTPCASIPRLRYGANAASARNPNSPNIPNTISLLGKLQNYFARGFFVPNFSN